jgi:hypothetical protein
MIDPIALLRKYHKAQNAFDMAAVESMFALGATYSTPAHQGKILGRDRIAMMMRKHFAEYTDQISRDELIEKVDDFTIWSKWHLNATSAFSGQKIIRKGIETITFNSQGLITSVEVKDE